MRPKFLALHGLLLIVAMTASAKPADLPGPNSATAPIFAHVDSLNGDAPLESLRDAIPWIMQNGDERALAVLEACLTDSTLLVRDREWMIRLFSWRRAGPDSPMPCAVFGLLERLLSGERLNPRDWKNTLEWLPWLVHDWPDCVTPGTLDLMDRLVIEPDFSAWAEMSELAGGIMRWVPDPGLKARAESQLWQSFERLGEGDGRESGLATVDHLLQRCYGELPLTQPGAVDERLLTWAARVLRARVLAGEDAERSAWLLLSCLRERPDLRASVDWASLNAALFHDRPLRTLHEGNAIAAANLISYCPQWATGALVDSLFAALVERDPAHLKNARSSYFGGIPDCIAACAVYGEDGAAAPAIAARLLAVAQAPDQAEAARPELAAALLTIYWRRPDLLNPELMTTLREAFRTNFRGMGSLHRISRYDLVAALLEIRPDLATDEDLPILWYRVSKAKDLQRTSLRRGLLALARNGSDETYCTLLARVSSVLASASASPEARHECEELLTRLKATRSNPPSCDETPAAAR